MMSRAIYLASTDVPVVQARELEYNITRWTSAANEPVKVKEKNVSSPVPLDVTLKPECECRVGIQGYQTHSCHVPPNACVLSGLAKHPVQLLPVIQPGE